MTRGTLDLLGLLAGYCIFNFALWRWVFGIGRLVRLLEQMNLALQDISAQMRAQRTQGQGSHR